MSIKNKQFLNPFQNYFGLGDLLFYVAIAPFFILRNYVIFFIASMIFAVLMQFSFQKVMKEKSVPLAGFSALLLVFVIVFDIFTDFQNITLV